MSFEREDRYIVIKIADIERLEGKNGHKLAHLRAVREGIDHCRVQRGAQPLVCAVIESDWPEYEPVWKMIEERVIGEQFDTGAAFKPTDIQLMNAVNALVAMGYVLDGDMWVRNREEVK